jgi:uncharacterized protein YabE (DUF348 family)
MTPPATSRPPSLLARWWPLALSVALLATFAALATTFLATRRQVTLVVNGRSFIVRTHQRSADQVLREAGIRLASQDQARLPSDAQLVDGAEIVLHLSRQLVLAADGQVVRIYTQAATIQTALVESPIALLEGDRFMVRGRLLAPDDPLPTVVAPNDASLRAWLTSLRRPLSISIRRASPIAIWQDGVALHLRTAALTVGDALLGASIPLYEGDLLLPAAETEIAPDMNVRLVRAQPVTLTVGGQGRMLRSRQATVDDLLRSQNVALGPLDYVKPEPGTRLGTGLLVRVVRVIEERFVEEIPMAFETRYEPDPQQEIDNREIASWGREGAQRRMLLVRYEDQAESKRTIERDWIERESLDRVIRYGTQIILRQRDTPDGPITYWRKIRVLATSYNAPTAGKSADHPNYGITRLGQRARLGIVAVDPRVINLRSNLYVPGYGQGVAGDTGGAIQWRRVDLCYDDDNLVLWHRWVDVYLLEPIPPADQINWTIPNYPNEKE